MIIRRAAAVRGGIGDFSSCMEIEFFFCEFRFRTHIIITEGKGTQKKHKKLTVKGGGSTLTVSLTVKYPLFYESPKLGPIF